MHPCKTVAVVLALVAVPAAVAAAPDGYEGYGRQRGSVRFDVHLDVGWAKAYGFGFRGDLAVAPDGILDRVDDDLALSLGAEAFVVPGKFAAWPLAALQWNFYLAHRWSVFPEVGVVAFTGPVKQHEVAEPFVYAAPFVSAGARFHFSPRNALLFRVNWPAGLQVGLTF